jgi:hypothetical protein
MSLLKDFTSIAENKVHGDYVGLGTNTSAFVLAHVALVLHEPAEEALRTLLYFAPHFVLQGRVDTEGGQSGFKRLRRRVVRTNWIVIGPRAANNLHNLREGSCS